MDLREMMDKYSVDGLTRELAAARVCQDIVLKAIAIGPLSRNVTIKGGVVMRSLTNNNRRATRDIDLDFIHYSIEDEAIQLFVQKMNCIPEIKIEIIGNIEELKHQDYHGKSIKVRITDVAGAFVESKSNTGVDTDLVAQAYPLAVDNDTGGVDFSSGGLDTSAGEFVVFLTP